MVSIEDSAVVNVCRNGCALDAGERRDPDLRECPGCGASVYRRARGPGGSARP